MEALLLLAALAAQPLVDGPETTGAASGRGSRPNLEAGSIVLREPPGSAFSSPIAVEVRPGQELHPELIFLANGLGAATTVRVAFRLDGAGLCTVQLSARDGFNAASCSTSTIPDRPFTLSAVLDSQADVAESDEGDNEMERRFVPDDGRGVNLLADAIELTTERNGGAVVDDPQPGDELFVRFIYSVEAEVSYYRRNEIRLDGERLCGTLSATPSTNLVGRRSICSAPIVIPDGPFTLTGETDYRDELAEVDESDNRIDRSYGGVEVPDGDALVGALTTLLGEASPGDGRLAQQAALVDPVAVAVAPNGDLYIAEQFAYRVRRVSASTGLIDTVVGTGDAGSAGDGGPGAQAQVNGVSDLVVDAEGRLYLADDQRLRRWDPATERIETLAVLSASVAGPGDALALGDGVLYHAGGFGDSVTAIDLATGAVTPIVPAGERGFGGDGGPAADAQLNSPRDLAVGPDGVLYVFDGGNARLRAIDLATGVIDTVVAFDPDAKGFIIQPGPINLIGLEGPDGNVLFRDGALLVRVANRVLSVDVAAGTVTAELATFDGRPIRDLVLDPEGRFVFAREGPSLGLVQRQEDDGRVETLAGGLSQTGLCSTALANGIAVEPADVAIGPNGVIHVVDAETNVVLAVDPTSETVTVLAGQLGRSGYGGDGGPAGEALLDLPVRVAVDGAGNVYVLDAANLSIRRIDAATGTIETFAGVGPDVDAPLGGDGDLATEVLVTAGAIAVGPSGALFYSDFGVVYSIDPTTRRIRRRAGDRDGSTQEGARPLAADLGDIDDLAFGSDGALYAADASGYRVLRIDLDADRVTTVAGNGEDGFFGDEPADGVRATEVALDEPTSLAIEGELLYVAERFAGRVRRIDLATGLMDVVAAVRPREDGTFQPVEGFERGILDEILDIEVDPFGNLVIIEDLVSTGRVHLLALNASSVRLPLGTDAGDRLGSSIASSGTRFAVGIPDDADVGAGTGAVAVYRTDGCRFLLEDRLTAPPGFVAQGFGAAVALDGDRLAVGTDGSTATKGGTAALQAAIYERTAEGWTFAKPLAPATPREEFGAAVALSGDVVAVGAPGADAGRGAVVVFDLSGRVDRPAREIGSLAGTGSDERFGAALALGDDKLAVGAPGSAVGGAARGSVALFDAVGENLRRLGRVASDDAGSGFGTSVALDGRRLAVGAPGAAATGEALLYDLGGGGLVAAGTLRADDGENGDRFGQSVALDGRLAFVGAPGAAASEGSGAIYGFDLGNAAAKGVPGALGKIGATFFQQGLGSAVSAAGGRLFGGAPDSAGGRGDAVAFDTLFNLGGLAGLWFDPRTEGEGFNVIASSAGSIVYFFGYDAAGERLWLVSDLLTEPTAFTEARQIPLFDARGGTFDRPAPSSESLAPWGTLSVTYSSADNGIFVLGGADGSKTSVAVKLIDAQGPNAGLSGLWFDPDLEGEGYNVIVSEVGTIIYFYGYAASGERLWLVSDLISGPLEVGTDLTIDLFEARGGTFDRPRPSAEALRSWGTLQLRFTSCTAARFELDGTDGRKVSRATKLLGIAGTVCQP